MTHDEIIEVIAAHRTGKALQVRRHDSSKWWNCDSKAKLTDLLTDLAHGDTFRVKPEPRRGWMPAMLLFQGHNDAVQAFPQADIIEVAEVIR